MVVAAVTSASEGTAQGVSTTQTDTCPAGFAALAGTAEEQVAVLAAPSLTSGWLYLTIIPRTCVGYELRTSSAIISSYPTSVSGIIVLLNTKHWINISLILFSTGSSFWLF